MIERDLIAIGFQLRGDGTLRAPAGTRVTLVIEGAFAKFTIALADGKSIETWVARSALKIKREEGAKP